MTDNNKDIQYLTQENYTISIDGIGQSVDSSLGGSGHKFMFHNSPIVGFKVRCVIERLKKHIWYATTLVSNRV